MLITTIPKGIGGMDVTLDDIVVHQAVDNVSCSQPVKLSVSKALRSFNPSTFASFLQPIKLSIRKAAPRLVVKKLLAELQAMGYRLLSGFEYEFYLASGRCDTPARISRDPDFCHSS